MCFEEEESIRKTSRRRFPSSSLDLEHHHQISRSKTCIEEETGIEYLKESVLTVITKRREKNNNKSITQENQSMQGDEGSFMA